MRRLLFILALLMSLSIHAETQDGLGVNQVFTRYGHEKGCKMVEMHDTKLHGLKIKTYKSLTYKRIGKEVNDILKNDRRSAKKIREVVTDGEVTSGYYMMPSLQKGLNRYILFSTQEGGSGAVIFIEGNLQPDDIIKLCYTRR